MTLESSIKLTIEHNVTSQLTAFEFTYNNKEELNQILQQWGGKDNPYEFFHGFVVGMLQGTIFSTARILLKRPVTQEERKELTEILESKKEKILDIVNRIKFA